MGAVDCAVFAWPAMCDIPRSESVKSCMPRLPLRCILGAHTAQTNTQFLERVSPINACFGGVEVFSVHHVREEMER
eukprot:3758145-Amphidinium_carterae.1